MDNCLKIINNKSINSNHFPHIFEALQRNGRFGPVAPQGQALNFRIVGDRYTDKNQKGVQNETIPNPFYQLTEQFNKFATLSVKFMGIY